MKFSSFVYALLVAAISAYLFYLDCLGDVWLPWPQDSVYPRLVLAAVFLLSLWLLKRGISRLFRHNGSSQRRVAEGDALRYRDFDYESSLKRHIPRSSNLLIDSCAWMSSYGGAEECFRALAGYALRHKVMILMPDCVLEELQANKHKGQEQTRQDAYTAMRRVEHLQTKLLRANLFRHLDLGESSRYADPQIVAYMERHPKTILISQDKELMIRVRELLQRKGLNYERHVLPFHYLLPRK